MTELSALQGQRRNPRQFHEAESAAFGKAGQFAPPAEDEALAGNQLRQRLID